MYKLRTITKPDGSTYESAFWINQEPQIMTQDQERMARAITAFGTSA